MDTPVQKIKLLGKVFIQGEIEVVTGLHIGGSKSDLDIGGVDLAVIKTADKRRVPFIPGSSLKGKLRTMLAREEGSLEVRRDSDTIKDIFGHGAEGKKKKEGDTGDKDRLPTRLIVRDARLDIANFDSQFDRDDLDTRFTMVKWENTINRKTGTAQHPRQIERVPSGARFPFSMVYNVFDDGKKDLHLNAIKRAMQLLEDDYLGGHGTRGYGQVRFTNVVAKERMKADYESGSPAKEMATPFWS
ncbi:MAG: type III-A CRISPR-associated RAMP protein Csm3 [Bacteroidota bacterium]